jgi:coenzyme F420-reducing hydrogenase beta subunit
MPLTGKAPTTATDALARMLVDGVIIMAGAFHDIPQISVSTRCEADTEASMAISDNSSADDLGAKRERANP